MLIAAPAVTACTLLWDASSHEKRAHMLRRIVQNGEGPEELGEALRHDPPLVERAAGNDPFLRILEPDRVVRLR